IIYCHSSKAGGIGRIANIGIGVPLVYNPHGWAFSMVNSGIKGQIYLWLERILSLFTTKFITISNYEKLIAVQRHVAKPSRIKTIFNGIDMDAVNRQLSNSYITRRSMGIPNDAYIIGMVGRISAQKAPDTFVKMAAKVKESISNAWFMIVGDGNERNEIEKLIADSGLSNCFTITGWVDNPLAYANLFDISVLLSRWEGFGLVLAEYMKLGKPIVATETNAIPDLITDHENGLLVEVDNHGQAAQAVLEIYDNENLRNNMIQKGEMRVNAFFDIRRTAMEHERLFVNIYERGGKM
ncbi:MAG: glycosyltransferase, partial [Prevotella sp.]|nr:glycosyltransferase [Prevotella sp.]